MLIYHHQGRIKGGAPQEFSRAEREFREMGVTNTCAVRLRAYQSRFYFLLNGDAELRRQLHDFALRWGGDKAEFFAPATELRD